MKISRALLDQIHRHLESGYPNEACGVMLGHGQVVSEAVPVENTRYDSAGNRYLIHPLAYRDIERDADARCIQVLGIYHSHPNVAARPSQFDLEWALPNLSYLIVSVVKGKAVESNSWRLRDNRSAFDQEPVEISA